MEIEVQVGDQLFKTVAGTDGAYEILVPEDVASGTVEVTARGKGDRKHIVLASYAGELESLRKQAGDDDVVDSSENHRLNVTEMSTAIAALVSADWPKDAVPTAELVAASERSNLDGQWALYGAAAIRKVMANGLLPGGAGNTYDMVLDYDLAKRTAHGVASDTAQEKTVVRQVKDGETTTGLYPVVEAFFNLAGDLLDDPDQIIPFVAEDLPEEYLLGSVNRSFEINTGKTLRFNADGTGTILHPTGATAMTWEIDPDGTLIVVPEDGLAETVTGGVFARIDNSVTALSYVMINRGELADTLVERATYKQDRYSSDDQLHQTIVRTVIQAYTAVRPEGRLAWTAEEVVGTWAMPGVNRRTIPNADAHAAQDTLFVFNPDNTGSLAGGEDPFSWSIGENGDLVVTFADSLVNRYVKLREGSPEMDVLAIAADTASATPAQFVNAGMAIKRDASLVLDNADLLKRFTLFGDEMLFGMDITANFENPLVFEVYDDSSMMRYRRDQEGELLLPSPDFGHYRWERNDNVFLAEKVFSENQDEVDPFCDDTDDTCSLLSDITWDILDVVDNRLYVLETTRVYDYLDLPGERTTRYTQSLVKWWQMGDHMPAD